jgi:hypothetical protein
LSALYDIAVRNIPHLQFFLHGMTVRSHTFRPVCMGIGFKLRYGTDAATLGIVYPTRFVHKQKTDVTLAGK